jgi:hypothetical protein
MVLALILIIVAFYNIAGTVDLGKIVDVKNIQLSGTGSGVFKIQASEDNVSWSTRLSMTVTQDAQSFRIRLSDNSVTDILELLELVILAI